jgi:hypothetical protein
MKAEKTKAVKKIMVLFLTILLFVSIAPIASALDNTPPNITDLGSREAHGGKYCKAIEIVDTGSGVKRVEITPVSNVGTIYSNKTPSVSGWDGSKRYFEYKPPKPAILIDVCYKDKSKPIEIKVRAKNGDGYWSVVKTFVNPAIPEFTTIAIPVATILGLVFLFSRRKRKE